MKNSSRLLAVLIFFSLVACGGCGGGGGGGTTVSPTPTSGPTGGPTPIVTPVVTPTGNPTPSVTPSVTPSTTPTISPTGTPTLTPTPTPFVTGGPYLLYLAANNDGGFTDRITPGTFKNDPVRLQHMQTMPFDGVAIASDPGWLLMQDAGRSFDLAFIRQKFSSMSGVTLGRLKHNFAIVNASKPGDFFTDTDWSFVVRNFANLAKVLRESGIEGILFDNEVYSPAIPMFNWPNNCDDKTKSLDDYRNQARKRGREIMQAMRAEYPDIVVIFLHGPYISAPVSGPLGGIKSPFSPRQSSPDTCELLGPFTVGFMEATGNPAQIVDGGEEYKFRTQQHFEKSYEARKIAMGSEAFNCPFVPAALRGANWRERLGISFGIMAEDWPAAGMTATPQSTEACLRYALQRADRYVWLYTETRNRRFMTPGGVSQDWIQAVWNARNAVPYR